MTCPLRRQEFLDGRIARFDGGGASSMLNADECQFLVDFVADIRPFFLDLLEEVNCNHSVGAAKTREDIWPAKQDGIRERAGRKLNRL
jgi:hypothetical protein